jgi:multisubunit Na+/H+ antiporter MnhB subunit
MDNFMASAPIYLGIILLVLVTTWWLNKRFDDDPIKDFFRLIAAGIATLGILFFWHWI